MGNTENMENAVVMENVEDMEDTVRTKEREMRRKYYKDLMAKGHVKINYSDYVIFGDSDAENIIEESDVELWAEAEVCPSFTVRALINSGNMDKLSWNSGGNEAYIQKHGKIWDRVGVSCFGCDEDWIPTIKICTDEDTLRNTDTHGNISFKAIMVKAIYSYIVPAYSTVDLKVSMNLHFIKRGGETSASYIGGVISSIDTWTTAKKSRISNWADNNGVIQPRSDKDCTKEQSNAKNDEFRLGINDYDCGEQKNDTNEAKVCYATFYFMCAIEKANSINHRLLMFDRADDKWNTKLTGTSTIYYDPNGGEMEQTQQTFTFAPDKYTAVTLYTAHRQGYILSGWYDRIADRYYAPGGIFTENRGVRLTAMWVPAQSSYTVNHFFQNLDGSYPETPDRTEQYTGPTGATISVRVMEQEGFSSPGNSHVNISEDGPQVVNLFYERKQYTITFLANGGVFTSGYDMETEDFMYETPGTQMMYPRVVSREGYTYKWSKTLSKMPAEDVTVRVIWTPKK